MEQHLQDAAFDYALSLTQDITCAERAFIAGAKWQFERSTTVWGFYYCSCTFESAAATMSLHTTLEGAEEAMNQHKENTKKIWEERSSGYNEQHKKDYPFDWNREWFVDAIKIQS